MENGNSDDARVLAGPAACNRYSGPKPPSPERNAKTVTSCKSDRSIDRGGIGGRRSRDEVERVHADLSRSRAEKWNALSARVTRRGSYSRSSRAQQEKFPAEMRDILVRAALYVVRKRGTHPGLVYSVWRFYTLAGLCLIARRLPCNEALGLCVEAWS